MARRAQSCVSVAGDGTFGLAGTERATAQLAQLIGREERFVTVTPFDEDRLLAQSGEARQTQVGRRQCLPRTSRTGIAAATAAQIFQRIDAVMPVAPLDPDSIASDLVQAADTSGRL